MKKYSEIKEKFNIFLKITIFLLLWLFCFKLNKKNKQTSTAHARISYFNAWQTAASSCNASLQLQTCRRMREIKSFKTARHNTQQLYFWFLTLRIWNPKGILNKQSKTKINNLQLATVWSLCLYVRLSHYLESTFGNWHFDGHFIMTHP